MLEQFELWLPTQKQLMASLEELRGKVLGCWCKSAKDPKPCHGDIYVKMLQTRPPITAPQPAPGARNNLRGRPFHKKQIVKPPAGMTAQGLLKFMEDLGVKLTIKDSEIVYRIPDNLNPASIVDIIKSRKNFMLAAIGGCESCKACGSVAENWYVCAYDAFFLGKAGGITPIDAARSKCPLNALAVV